MPKAAEPLRNWWNLTQTQFFALNPMSMTLILDRLDFMGNCTGPKLRRNHT